jgi:hypothetical protein
MLPNDCHFLPFSCFKLKHSSKLLPDFFYINALEAIEINPLALGEECYSTTTKPTKIEVLEIT